MVKFLRAQTPTLCMALVLFFTSCVDSNDSDTSDRTGEKGQFNLSFSSSSISNGRTQENENAAFIAITLRTPDGDLILNLEQLSILELDGQYISESIELEEGEYFIEDFLVLNEDREVIYLAPKLGSELEDLVDQPLPILISISANKTTLTTVQVVSADAGGFDDFGYAAFSFDIIDDANSITCEFTDQPEDVLNINGNFDSVSIQDGELITYPHGPLVDLFNEDGTDGQFFLEFDGNSFQLTNEPDDEFPIAFGSTVSTFVGEVTPQAYSGCANLRITQGEENASDFAPLKEFIIEDDRTEGDSISLEVGGIYTVSMKVKVLSSGAYSNEIFPNFTDAHFVVFGIGTNGWTDLNAPKPLSDFTSGTWEEYSFEFTVTNAFPNDFMALRLRGEADVLIDDFFVRAVSLP